MKSELDNTYLVEFVS